MKTLIVSDIHLSHIFDKKKFLFLEKLFSSCDRIILNGDFWDGYITTFDRFIDSPWKNLFPLLKNKGAIYLFGNHDQEQFSDKRTSLFSIEQKDSYQLKTKKTIYHIEHGHILCPAIDGLYPLSRKSLYYFNKIFQKIEHMLILMKSPHNFFMKLGNLKIKKRLRNIQFPYWYLCGHTHYAEIDKQNKFCNSGFIQYGKASYLIADSSGLSLRIEWYK